MYVCMCVCKICQYACTFEVSDPCVPPVIQAMGRGYSAQRYRDLISLLRSHMPDAAISADCIVGFPGKECRIGTTGWCNVTVMRVDDGVCMCCVCMMIFLYV